MMMMIADGERASAGASARDAAEGAAGEVGQAREEGGGAQRVSGEAAAHHAPPPSTGLFLIAPGSFVL